LDLQSEGYKVLFSYEEAIGFCCGDMIVDKDGVSAAGGEKGRGGKREGRGWVDN
jgi:hypothetical protein